jgi:colicin import membrane protein
MHKPRTKANVYKAALYTFIVHALIFELLFLSFVWKHQPQMDVAEVTLWDALPPTRTQSKPEPVVEPVPEKPVEKPIIQEEPVEEKPEVIEKPEETIDENAIALEKKKAEDKRNAEAEKQKKIKEKKEAEKKIALEKIQKELIKDQQQAKEEKLRSEALKKLQAATLAEEDAARDTKAQATRASANASVIGEYTNKIKIKIRGNVNKSLCGDDDPELKFIIGLLPTGELNPSTPKLVKSSGNSVCDEAVERAIVASQPLPLPDDKTLYSEFRKLNLTFRPNDE